ncbi:UDP:flavonoid glycosyltransferase YjiC (YdhE family) [Catenuloplanes atrovinosus]|uniref:UDP:flavonoid glycosyltransferase YjiC (YdhE family) n=2 Tax=Catenuloplanes atrovinosus TaxID=137266 RepID=A0AAE4CBU6_9ACTN|nr:glycosyltransferase [Catenuloplanes atrovinosus]MDR7277304.1 UDP:flavonoid glycosyltransferase YjiC (YdhE family) [Catenuloplanes atrovinosus]
MVTLGVELVGRGHDVVLAVPDDLVSFGLRAGVPTVSAGVNAREFLQSPDGQRWLAAGNVRQYLAGAARKRAESLDSIHTALLAATRDADVIVTGRLTEDDAATIAEWAGVPLVCLHYAPWRPNPALPSYFVSTRRLPAAVNTLTHRVAGRAHWKAFGPGVAALRRRLGMAPSSEPTPERLRRMGSPEVQAYSPVLVPELAGWSPRRPLVGFLSPDPAARRRLGMAGIDPALRAWLDAGDPPIYFGFGSMPVADPRTTLDMIRRVSTTLGRRALVGAGWSEVTEAGDDDVRIEGELDHASVFPRCRAAVHHGGAGTTYASIAAGLPTLVCSVFSDQPFWGERLRRLGAGDRLRFADLTEQRLLRGVQRVLAGTYRDRAAELAARLHAEGEAAARAADIVEKAR